MDPLVIAQAVGMVLAALGVPALLLAMVNRWVLKPVVTVAVDHVKAAAQVAEAAAETARVAAETAAYVKETAVIARENAAAIRILALRTPDPVEVECPLQDHIAGWLKAKEEEN